MSLNDERFFLWRRKHKLSPGNSKNRASYVQQMPFAIFQRRLKEPIVRGCDAIARFCADGKTIRALDYFFGEFQFFVRFNEFRPKRPHHC